MSALQIAIAIAVSATSENRKALVEAWANQQSFPLTASLPCGQHISLTSGADLPVTNMPCPCGDGRHWLVKYAD